MNRLLATGSSGTIGRHFRAKVQEISCDLSLQNWSGKNLDFTQNDVIIHCAAIVGVEAVMQNERLAQQVNVEASRKLAQLARRSEVSRFIYVSTSHVYASSNDLITEMHAVSPQNIYAEQKYQAENAIAQELANSNTEFCIARVFSVLDWDVQNFTLGGSIRNLVSSNSDKRLINSDDIRDFLTPKTIANTLIAIAEKPGINNVVNICSGKGISVGSAARTMFEVSGMSFPLERTVAGNSANPHIVGDNSKLKAHLPNLNLKWEPSKFDSIKK